MLTITPATTLVVVEAPVAVAVGAVALAAAVEALATGTVGAVVLATAVETLAVVVVTPAEVMTKPNWLTSRDCVLTI